MRTRRFTAAAVVAFTFLTSGVQAASHSVPSQAANNTIIGIDRIDQRGNNLDRQYFYERTGIGVSVYVVDTGVNVKHNDFGGRAIPLFDFQRGPTDPDFAQSIDDHGTVAASQIGSKTYGVAKNATMYSVRVLDAFGNGSVQTVLNGLETVRQHITGQLDGVVRRPAVVSLGFGFYCRNSFGQAPPFGFAFISDTQRGQIENAVQALVNAGAVVVTGTNNDLVNTDFFTPARMGIRSSQNGVITVGGTDAVDDGTFSNDQQYFWSGSPVEIHAPAGRDGVFPNGQPTTPWNQRGLSFNLTYGQGGFLRGNSAATPLVAGAVALYLENASNLPAAQQPTPGSVELAVLSARSFTPQGTGVVYTGCEFLPPHAENPILDTRRYVKQQYFDFLGRQPDDAGWNHWVGQVNADANCGVDRTGCFGRVNTAKAFFESIELSDTAFFAYRLHRMTFSSFPKPEHGFSTRQNPRMERLWTDARKIGRNVVVGVGNWAAILESNQRAFVATWVASAEFQNLYPLGMNNTTFITTLYSNAQVPFDASGQAAINRLDAGEGRATVLYDLVKAPAFASRDRFTNPDTVRNLWNPYYVLFNFIGFLRRNPDDPPDFNTTAGYDFWLNTLNSQVFAGDPGAYHNLIRAFATSGEYLQRFYSDPHCGQPAPPAGGGGGGGIEEPPPDPEPCRPGMICQLQ
ncbi:MAG TPA: S8 family serine peptidase [Thermoanaerobaculia bacterium]